MAESLESLLCPACGSYVHPFLDACPRCATARPSRYEEAAAGSDLGLRALLVDPDVTGRMREMVTLYSLRTIAGPGQVDVRGGAATLAGALAYRASVVGGRAATSDRAFVELGEEDLAIREHNPPREVVRVPLDMILAIAPATKGGPRPGAWTGLAFEGRVEHATASPIDGDIVFTYAALAGLGRVALANRRGLFSAKARPDHFGTVARWVGVVAAAAAEERWSAIGARRYAARLGLASAPEPTSWPKEGTAPGAQPPIAAVAPGEQPPSVRRALEALEEVRAAGLVTDTEYAEKRREILRRL